MVCPNCGNDTFEQSRTARVAFTMQYAGGQWIDLSEDIVSAEGAAECDEPITCTDCGNAVEGSDLVTENDYNEGD